MKFTTLSSTDIRISKICLGTMGFGRQVSEEIACKQLDYALAHEVNFIDTAEMYPIPPSSEYCGITETIIGKWLKKSGKRSDIVLATKVAGPGRYGHLRGGNNRLNMGNIEQALDASLKRLQTDHVDLYQLHWPDRNVPYFGQRGYVHRKDEESTPIEETLAALKSVVKKGKVKAIGLSNESPWGTMEFLRIAREKGLPRMVSVQNPYSLLNRHYEIAMAEVSMRETIGLLAYSPLGYGILGGRYFDGQMPAGGRFAVHKEFAVRYQSPRSLDIAMRYSVLAKKHGLTLPQMSLAFVHAEPFVTSTIIGASSVEQLGEDISSIDLALSDEVLSGIEEIHEQFPNTVA